MNPTTVLQPGATGDSVKQLQSYLVSNGYLTQAQVDTGSGIYGPQTTAAVTALQKKLGVDNAGGVGYFGPKTIAAIAGNTTTPTTQTAVPPTPQTLNSGNTAPTTPINYVTPQATPGYPVGSLDTTIPTPPAPATPTETKANDLSASLISLNDMLVGKTAYQAEQNTIAGVDDATKTITDLSARLTGLQNEEKAIPIQLQNDAAGRGITAGGLAPIQSAKLRDNAVEALTVSTLLEAAKGNLTNAQALADKAVLQKYGPIQEQITAATANLKLILDSPQYTLDQKNRAQQQLDIQNARQDQLDKAKADTTAISTVAINAAQYSSTFTPTTQYPTVSTALSAISKATTPAEAIAIASSTGLTKPVDLQTSVVEVNGQKVLIDSNTGKTIKVLGSATTPTSQYSTTTTSIDNDVTAILEGRNTAYNIRQTMGRTNAAATYMQAVRDKITAIDPNFDFVASDAGGKSVSSAYVQRATAAINSVLPNIDKIIQLSNDVQRIGVKGVDAALQKAGLQINNQKISNFHEAQKLISDEIGVALGAGSVSDMKLQLGFDVTDPSVSQEVFASNMSVVKEFVENRLAGLNSLRYQSSTVSPSSSSSSSFGTGSPDLNSLFDNLFSTYGGK